LGPLLSIRINIGTVDKDRLSENRNWIAVKVNPPNPQGKAHAKFISGGGGVLVTSANFTPCGMNESVESGMVTNSLQMQAFFNRFWTLMRNATAEDKSQFHERWPRYFVPATISARSSVMTRLSRNNSGILPGAIS
jgi:hypothetical protein